MRRGRSLGHRKHVGRRPDVHPHSVLDGIDDGPLREFLKGCEATAIQNHFFKNNGLPRLAVLVTYTLEPSPVVRIDGAGGKKEPGWRSVFKVAPRVP